MSDSVPNALGVFALLLASTAAGAYARSRLPERHRSDQATQAAGVATGMIVTFAAVVLGLLTNSANQAFNQVDTQLRGYAALLIQLDQGLREYGGDAEALRRTLRSYTAAAIADAWSQESPPPGDYYPRHPSAGRPGEMETAELGRMLQDIEVALRRMDPSDPYHQRLASETRSTMERLIDLRWRLIESTRGGVSAPLLAALLLWLLVAFACFGLTAPHTTLTYAAAGLAALVLASAVFLLLDFENPLSGFITISSAPLRDALAHMSP